jgi:hypothetical protein
MAVASHRLLIVTQPEIIESAPRRPSVGLRHYIPLFFLAPSLLLLVHAWNRTAPPEPRVFVEIDSGNFEFPRDVLLDVRLGDGSGAPVEGGQASFPAPAPGTVEVRLFVSRPDRSDGVAVGPAGRFERVAGDGSVRWSLRVGASDCAAALRRLRAPR